MDNCLKISGFDPIFCHHLYEYQKGLRSLILHTFDPVNQPWMEKKLKKNGVAFHIYKISENKSNIFFGSSVCVDVIKQFGKSSLSDYTPEEDFILGTMLGYCREQQCERYLRLTKNITAVAG
jgi:hypothetical protein